LEKYTEVLPTNTGGRHMVSRAGGLLFHSSEWGSKAKKGGHNGTERHLAASTARDKVGTRSREPSSQKEREDERAKLSEKTDKNRQKVKVTS